MKFEGRMDDNGERRQMELKGWVQREEVEICVRKREIWRKEQKWEKKWKFWENLIENGGKIEG